MKAFLAVLINEKNKTQADAIKSVTDIYRNAVPNPVSCPFTKAQLQAVIGSLGRSPAASFSSGADYQPQTKYRRGIARGRASGSQAQANDLEAQMTKLDQRRR